MEKLNTNTDKLVRRIYVEKKPGLDVEARSLYHDLKHNLGIQGLTGVRKLNRYDVQGMTDEEFEKAKRVIFSEPNVDIIYEEKCPVEAGTPGLRFFLWEYLPGQYDQRADSAAQCVQILTRRERPLVRVAALIVLEGDISDEDFERIKNYCINPIEAWEASQEKPTSLEMQLIPPSPVPILEGFIEKSDQEIEAMVTDMGLAMSAEDLKFVRDYFRDQEKRNPTLTEIRVIDTYWSDHCRHTTFLTEITELDIEKDDSGFSDTVKDIFHVYKETREELQKATGKAKDMCLMDMATIAMRYMRSKGMLDDLDESEEVNACSIKIKVDVDGREEDWLLMFKNETHNHPTEIEPFGGASTCLGGAIRDPLSGRSYVYQAMRITGSGDPTVPVSETLPGKLSQIKITTGAAAGYSSYGNQIGLATGKVEEIYDPGFIAKRMELGAVIAAAPRDNVVRETPKPGDLVILLGGRTGRDGCGGAIGSSKEHTEESLTSCGSEVQKGNPPTERNIQRLFRRPEASRLIKKCNDFGAGGVCVAIGELADGLFIDLDAVPKKYEGLDGTELAISESQERMAVVVSREDAEKFIALAAQENLEATVVAQVNDSGRMVMQWQGSIIVDISRDFLNTNGVKQRTRVYIKMPDIKENYFYRRRFEHFNLAAKSCFSGNGSDYNGSDGNEAGGSGQDIKEAWLANLSDLNVCSQQGLVEMFDSTIGAGTVLMPLGGSRQLTPAEGMAAKIPVLGGDTNTCSLMSFGYNAQLAKWSPMHGAVYAIIQSVAKIVAMGGDHTKIRLSLQEYFEKLGSDPVKWGKPASALLGAFFTQMKLGIPAIGGKDSMSGTFKDLHVPPTLVSFAVATTHMKNVLSPEFKKPGSRVALFRLRRGRDEMPDFQQLDRHYRKIHQLIASGKILSAKSVTSGGVAEAISKMCFGNWIGFELAASASFGNGCDWAASASFGNDFVPGLDAGKRSGTEYSEWREDFSWMFAPDFGSMLLELADGAEEELEGYDFYILGSTIEEPLVRLKDKNGCVEIKLDEMLERWTAPLEKVFPTRTDRQPDGRAPLVVFRDGGRRRTTGVKVARPRVYMPVFPGTNCEFDSARAFEKAGAVVDLHVLRNLSPRDVEESIREMCRFIDNAQIIMIPGGFSGGDEPDGSGKFIATAFRNPYVKEAVMNFLNKRDGLMLGICNGFQALIKLGLVPYGEIRDLDENSPTLTFNCIGRHMSRLDRTRIASNKSPWFAKVEVGDIHVIPVSHGEGRFIAPPEVIAELERNGQIATQYVDDEGQPTYDIRFNPNGSMYAIEGITSPDGRILGKMGHSERIGPWLYKNVPGPKDQQLFESGVAYFS